MTDFTKLGGRWRAVLKYPGIDADKVRLIGWGAGEMFDLYYPRLEMDIAYSVCPWTGGRGVVKHGVEIRNPKALLDEDPDHVLVVILAGHWAEILRQIADIGPFRAVRATSEVLTDPILRAASTLGVSGSRRDGPRAASPADAPEFAIIMQGPIYPHWTRLSLLWNRAHHPGARLILSTWEGQDPRLVEEFRGLADDMVVSPLPPSRGFSNRNAQIRSTRLGLEVAENQGIPFAVKSRSDQFLTGEAIGRLFANVAPAAGPSPATNDSAVPHRIGVHFGTSWKFIPFQMSDQLQAGRTQDLLKLWSCPEDPRGDEAFPCPPDSHFQRLREITNESYVFERYAAGLGLPTRDLVDSCAFVRDNVFPLDAWVQPFSLKGIALFDVFGGPPEMQRQNAGRELLSPGFDWWMGLQLNFAHAQAEARRVQMSPFTVQDFWTLKVR